MTDGKEMVRTNMSQPNTMREKALNYLFKRIKKARIAMSKEEQKNGAEREIENIKRKIEVLEWLTGIALKEDGRQ